MSARLLIGIITAAIALSGCISTIDVRPIKADDKTTRGLRYSLPATYLLVQPQADGTANYTWIYLPDPDRTFVINKRSFLAKFTLDVATSNGLLTSIQAQGDTSGVASKLFDAAQSVYAAKVGAQSKSDATAATGQAASKTAIAAAQLAVDQAVAEQTIVNGDGSATAAEKRAAEIKVSNAQIALKALQDAKASADNNASADAVAGPFKQFGPVLFRVVQDGGQITLLAMNDQQQYDTVVAASNPTASTPPTNTLTLAAGQKIKAGRDVTVKITLSTPIESVDGATSLLNNKANGLPFPTTITVTLGADKKTMTAVFTGPLPAGTYTFAPAIVATPGATAGTPAQVDFTVQ